MKKKKTVSKKPKVASKSEKMVFQLVLMVVLVLVLISLFTTPASILDDINTVSERGLFNTKAPQNYVEVPIQIKNPIGAIGAFTSYGTTLIFGHKYSLILSLTLLMLLVFNLFKIKKRKEYFLLLMKLNYFGLALQTLLSFPYRDEDRIAYGVVSETIVKLLAITGNTGTIVILVFLNLILLGFIIGFENVASIFGSRKQKVAEKTPKVVKAKKTTTEKTNDLSDYKVETEIVNEGVTPEININTHTDLLKGRDEHLTFPKKKAAEKVIEDNFEMIDYVLPNIEEILTSPPRSSKKNKVATEEDIKRTSAILKEKLSEFDVESDVLNVNVGPIITQYELRPAPGVKVNRFTALSDDLALALKAKSIRIQAPIPGRGLIGIELPNIDRDVIYLRDVLLSDEMNAIKSPLGIALGKDISGRPVVGELTKMPHLLVAGATGSGKSVCINTIITSLILKKRPDELRLILIDPKRVELAPYAAIPHLIGSVVTDPERALENLQWAEEEMERRYRCLQDLKVRDIASYNEKVTKLKAKAEEAGIEPDHYLLPFIVIVVDEFADLIMTAGRDVELPITRLAQKARAVGIHLILATQRPSRKVITGLIKANFPSRIAFQVSSRVESSIILDTIGAEKLLGRGDMLYLPAGTALAERVHGCFVSDQEVEELCDYLSQQPKPVEIKVKREIEDSDLVMDYDDDLFPDAARLVVENNMASVSMLQRHFKIGYARAGRLIDLLEKAGIIGPHLGSKSRDVIAKEEDLDRYGL
jgi:S-DNA-T family DNA segregation ATPase FtsK/SpoIIIE